jgi:hypothetical protein
MTGTRLPETFGGDFAYSSSEANIPSDAPMVDEASSTYADFEGGESERWQDSDYESGHHSSASYTYDERNHGGDAMYANVAPEPAFAETYGDAGFDQGAYDGYDDAGAPAAEITTGTFDPPIGYWNASADFSTQRHSIHKMIQNRANTFDLFSHIEYKLADGSKTKWKLADEWGKDGKNTPYAYSGSPFTGDRVVSRVWVLEASHNAPVSQTLHFAGPTHVVLKPGEKLETPVLLWFKDVTSRRSPIIEDHPGVTESDLRSELMMNSNPRERHHVKNLAAGSSILLKYIQDKIDNEGFEDRLVPVLSEGYYKIPNNEAENFIRLWKIDQSRDLTVKELYNLTVKPNRAVRSSKDSPSFHEDPFQDKAEIIGSMDAWTLGDPAEEKSYATKVVRDKPITVYWKIRVELVPASKAGH